jgi:hypothetical protein
MKKKKKQSGIGIIMICSYCGRLLQGQETWEKDSKATVEADPVPRSHGICPTCLLENFPNEYLVIQEAKRIRMKDVFKSGFEDLYGHLVK